MREQLLCELALRQALDRLTFVREVAGFDPGELEAAELHMFVTAAKVASQAIETGYAGSLEELAGQ